MSLSESVKLEFTINGGTSCLCVFLYGKMHGKKTEILFNSRLSHSEDDMCACHFQVEINFMICENMPEIHCSVYVINTENNRESNKYARKRLCC